jgi:hypothetical protein
MHASARTVLLADELVRITGWGVEPNRLARSTVLRQLAEVDLSLSPITAGCIIERYIKDAIQAFTDEREFDGRTYDAHTLRRAFSVELGLEQGHLRAPIRQYRVVQILGVGYSYDQWRKHPRLRRGLLTLLAESMMSRHLSEQKESVSN